MTSQSFKEKIITSSEMARVENLAIAQGSSDEEFMNNAGAGIAFAVESFIEKRKLAKTVTLLIGKGNNGGDAYTAGISLLQKGFRVQARQLIPKEICSFLCQKKREHFASLQGEILEGEHLYRSFPTEGIILDGIFGTGFKGRVEGAAATLIQAANHSRLPIFAIDIPSGVDGSSGKVENIAIVATKTFYLGLPKLGCFIGDGFNYVGKLHRIDYGLPQHFVDVAAASAYLVQEQETAHFLPTIKRTRHKYEAGYIVALAGSQGMEGAGVLSTSAALHSGAGIVRLFVTDPFPRKDPIEVVKEFYEIEDPKRIFEEFKRADSILLGPGLGRSKTIQKMLRKVVPKVDLPIVIDADGLFFYAENPSLSYPKRSILTPHFKEMQSLLGRKGPVLTKENVLSICQEFVNEKKVTLVLKGAPTFIFHEDVPPLCIARGDPGMATAGSGDVLTGMIASFLAQGLYELEAACLATFLHGLAGEHAAKDKTSYCLVASDLIEYLPKAFSQLLR